MQVGAEPQFLHGVSAVPDGTAILCSGNRLSEHRVQPSGLRPQPAFSGVELSHSPVSTTQCLTASTVSMSYRQASRASFYNDTAATGRYSHSLARKRGL